MLAERLMACGECRVEFNLNHTQRWKIDTKRTDMAFCGRSCARKYQWANNPRMMSSDKRSESARRRLKEFNHLQTPENIAKNAATRIARGVHRGVPPPVRGGNGRGPSAPQLTLSLALGWEMEVAIPTGMPRGTGYPTNYKVDVANRDRKIAVEVDGQSHRAAVRMAQDRKKTDLLVSLGWRVLRFTNLEVTESLEACVREVLSTT